MDFRELYDDIREDAAEWSQGRIWFWRGPICLYLAYAGLRHVSDPYYGSIFSGITFGIHELGHVLFSVLGQFLMILGGTLTQVAAPVAAALIFFRQRDYFGISVAGSWLAFSLFGAATYIGDARSQELPLLGLSSDPIHDWNYILSTLGLLGLDGFFAFLTRGIALSIMVLSLGGGFWLCWRMATDGRKPDLS